MSGITKDPTKQYDNISLVRVGRSFPPPHSSLGVLDLSQAKKRPVMQQVPSHKPSQVFQRVLLLEP